MTDRRSLSERIVAHRFRDAALSSLQLEAHIFGFLGRGFIGVTDVAAMESGGDPPRGLAHVIVRLLSAPYLKLSAAGYSERLRLTAEELKRRNPCDVDVGTLSEQAREAIPRWNTIARIALPSVIRAWQPAVVMDLDAERTRAVIPCKTTDDADEVTICALREADKKYRVPFVTARSVDNVPYQTERVLEDTMFQCGVSGPFLTQCVGMVGVTVSAGFDGKIVRKREPAP